MIEKIRESQKANPFQIPVYPHVINFALVAEQLKIQLLQGFSMVPLHYRDKIHLVAFGGNKKEPSDKVK